MAEKKINGRTFKVAPMLAIEAVVMQARLMQLLGGALDRLPEILAGRNDKATDEMKAKSDAMAVAAFTDIFKHLDPREFGKLVKDIVELASIQRESGTYDPVDMDGDFTGNLKDLIPVVIFVLGEQFGDFFSGALASGNLSRVARA
ncbi:hypothetical protein IFT84_17430 [Rhizobium sp. CFBP 8762]|uniref:phage tail assembly chaperone n=1 Tax=Rhizobium sp. CFBP 8762 TaxID=2775279 RepID=UPI0017805225|nr:hypothetical protein [Rhizobium sp. CFBP 8762]MBD8556293.1 hypothetical protein [Rhizobium sp. CFBP 8762]